MSNKTLEKENVKKANKQFYDAVADSYELIDGRRSLALEQWLTMILKEISEKVHGGSLLDIGSGSGFVTRCAKGLFSERIGYDISPKILASNLNSYDLAIAGDVDSMPLKAGTIDVVSCFAVLHHLYDYESVITEAARVLKPGGIFYSDHDMDKHFYDRYSILLSTYRKLAGSEKKYTSSNGDVTKAMYHMSEWNENGIDTEEIEKLLNKNGFTVYINYHWYGLHKITDKLFGRSYYKSGNAPLVKISAVKK